MSKKLLFYHNWLVYHENGCRQT